MKKKKVGTEEEMNPVKPSSHSSLGLRLGRKEKAQSCSFREWEARDPANQLLVNELAAHQLLEEFDEAATLPANWPQLGPFKIHLNQNPSARRSFASAFLLCAFPKSSISLEAPSAR